MATHAELMNELPLLERMSTAERMRLAKKRRAQQLRKYQQLDAKREKEQQLLQQQNNPTATTTTTTTGNIDKNVSFVPSVVLLEAGSRNDVEEVEQLLKSGVNPDLRNDDGLSVLHQCCIENWKDLLSLLLDGGADPDVMDNEGWTPLHTAATCGRVQICKILIDRGADLLAVNADGNMAYDICQDQATLDFIEQQMAEKGITQTTINERRTLKEKTFLKDLEEIFNSGGDLHYKGQKGETPLHIAASNGYLSVAKFLLEGGADVMATDDDLWQPIHCATCWDQPQMLELLVEHGASLDVKTKNGETPLDICEDLEMRQRILQLQKDKKLKSSTGKGAQTTNFCKTVANQGRRGSITNTRRFFFFFFFFNANTHTNRYNNTHTPTHTHTTAHTPTTHTQSTHTTAHTPTHARSNTTLQTRNSASVRRSSTSQKKSLALKEAKEEAMRLKMEGKNIDGPIKDEVVRAMVVVVVVVTVFLIALLLKMIW
ncbi:hypothetical protein HELRODRAFT_90384 [Helobdella robusta]|uniref:Uncharacterized protein n=1 Tax=Helobdella robusta TaxID=6412 RepID=T1G7Q4_HELRO|nr:hypothetical protein HELRODRAFT_90384 [Helobdella robusta]ESN91175.1 hypothetical protein HELRODRAFT_90384 [Helobdella robusta]